MNYLKKVIFNHIIPSIGRLAINKNRFINVIYYHDIVNGAGQTYMRTNRIVFQRQMEIIAANGACTYIFEDLDKSRQNETFKKNSVLITFDDGWKSNYDILPLMKNLGLKYNIFLEVGKINVDPNYLTWDEIHEMQESGIVGFGAHTLNHPNMSALKNYKFEEEIIQANAIIEKKLGIKPNDFCFPFGAYNKDTLSQIVNSGSYRRIYTSDMNYSYQDGECIIMGRNAISNDDSDTVFHAKTKGYYNIYKTIKRL